MKKTDKNRYNTKVNMLALRLRSTRADEKVTQATEVDTKHIKAIWRRR
jgi:hypothetical protein